MNSNLDQRLTKALESAPRFTIPNDFAARVASRLPARPTRALVPAISSPGIGRRAWLIALCILFVAVFALALYAGPANQLARLTLESVLAAEFILLTVWLTLRPQSLR